MKTIKPRFFPLLLPLLFFAACFPALPIESPFDGNTGISTPNPSPMRILVIDVGQGDSTLVIGPTGRALLIDGGPPGAGFDFVLPVLEAEGIGRLDWIVATHYDADHIGGLPEIFQGETLVDRGDATVKTTPSFQDYRETASDDRRTALPGEVLNLGGGAEATVIVVNGRYADGRSIHLNPDEENEASIGLLIRHGDFEYFTAGDLTGGGAPGGYETKDLETIAGEIIGDIDVLHVGHHGSETSSNENFLETIRPEAAVISVGRHNDYGHPAPDTLRRLESIGAIVYRTDETGTLEIRADGSGYEIMP